MCSTFTAFLPPSELQTVVTSVFMQYLIPIHKNFRKNTKQEFKKKNRGCHQKTKVAIRASYCYEIFICDIEITQIRIYKQTFKTFNLKNFTL